MSFYSLLDTIISKLNKSIKIEAQSLSTSDKSQARANINAASKNDVYRKNLLDNSDFRNPVNQRGQTSYVYGTGPIYTIDRWKLWGGGVTITDAGINISSEGIFQYFPIENFSGSYTLAAKRTDGVLFVLCINSIDQFYWGDHLAMGKDGSLFTIAIYGPGEYEWAALYEGEYTAETLPEYRPKGYVAELEECQRYYREFHNRIAIGYAYDSNCMCFTLPVNPPMRIDTPTITLSNGSVLHKGLQTSTYLHEVWVSKGIIAFDMRPSDSSGPFTVNSSGLSFGDLYISADL